MWTSSHPGQGRPTYRTPPTPPQVRAWFRVTFLLAFRSGVLTIKIMHTCIEPGQLLPEQP